ncbi:rhomboid family intramembrane serine protease [Nonomuraea sp. K274]|uniref:Rhomboid family intramembrane serine protease n=1 Tax=Nonomuraea cypriaca TaxID=1187855 RepID=A0A931EVG1_9ACTN|nr:rhomboid family intramembrane serine protease [Nonomuraea cypriaca]MBF8185614.1 rhomboid family intramembrane serine protease [Nonomuraea cypriaca]
MTSQPPPPPQPEQPAEAVPTCYRHPSRETWVRCQRCDRPICPDCMRDAAVGFQCPECVAEGNRGIRQAKTAFGGNIVRTPYVTWAILGITALVFGAQLLAGSAVTAALAMFQPAVALGEYHRLLTVALVHDAGSPLHLLFNGWAIFAIGPYLERAFGHLRFLAVYLLSALGGSVLGFWLDPMPTITVGASGAVFGMFGAVFVVGRKLKLDVRGIGVVIALNLAITFIFPLLSSNARISWTGHVGGLIVGTLLAGALAYAPKSNRTLWHVLTLAGAFVLLGVLVVVRTSAILSGAS